MLRLIFAGILFFFAGLYVFVSFRDTLGDLRFIFERRLVRKFLTKFTLRTLFGVTAAAALFLACARGFQVPVAEWPILALGIGFLIGTILLLGVAVKDLRFRGTRRQHPSSYRSEQKAESAPEIRTFHADLRS